MVSTSEEPPTTMATEWPGPFWVSTNLQLSRLTFMIPRAMTMSRKIGDHPITATKQKINLAFKWQGVKFFFGGVGVGRGVWTSCFLCHVPMVPVFQFHSDFCPSVFFLLKKLSHNTQGPKGEGGGGPLEPRHFCCVARAQSPMILMPGALNIWSQWSREPKGKCYGALIFLSWSSGAPYVLGQSPGVLNPLGTLNTENWFPFSLGFHLFRNPAYRARP